VGVSLSVCHAGDKYGECSPDGATSMRPLLHYCSRLCIVRGEWSSWSAWSDCGSQCPGGFQRRTRTCVYSAAVDPSDGRAVPCRGEASQKVVCSSSCSPGMTSRLPLKYRMSDAKEGNFAFMARRFCTSSIVHKMEVYLLQLA